MVDIDVHPAQLWYFKGLDPRISNGAIRLKSNSKWLNWDQPVLFTPQGFLSRKSWVLSEHHVNSITVVPGQELDQLVLELLRGFFKPRLQRPAG